MKTLLIFFLLLSFSIPSCGGGQESRRRLRRAKSEQSRGRESREGPLARRRGIPGQKNQGSSRQNPGRETVFVRVIAEERQGSRGPSEQKPKQEGDSSGVQVKVVEGDTPKSGDVPQQAQNPSKQATFYIDSSNMKIKVIKEDKLQSKVVVQQSVQVSSGQASEENLIFPIVLNSDHEAISFESTLEKNKVSISAEPENVPMTLIASLSGEVSITEEGRYYNVFINSATDNRTPHFRLIRKHTDLLVLSGEIVQQGQQLATTTKFVTFYIKTDEKLLDLCIPHVESEKVAVINRIPDSPDCNVRQTVGFTIFVQ